MSGLPFKLKLLTPRIRICGPEPTWPVPGITTTPGARLLIRFEMSGAGAKACWSAAWTVDTELPSDRFSMASGVPVTTISARLTACSLIVIRISVFPTGAVTVIGRKPIMLTRIETSLPERPLSVNRPRPSVRTSLEFAETRAPSRGRPDRPSSTTPETSWAAARPAARAISVAAIPTNRFHLIRFSRFRDLRTPTGAFFRRRLCIQLCEALNGI